jgi:hypothetical protein
MLRGTALTYRCNVVAMCALARLCFGTLMSTTPFRFQPDRFIRVFIGTCSPCQFASVERALRQCPLEKIVYLSYLATDSLFTIEASYQNQDLS